MIFRNVLIVPQSEREVALTRQGLVKASLGVVHDFATHPPAAYAAPCGPLSRCTWYGESFRSTGLPPESFPEAKLRLFRSHVCFQADVQSVVRWHTSAACSSSSGTYRQRVTPKEQQQATCRRRHRRHRKIRVNRGSPSFVARAADPGSNPDLILQRYSRSWFRQLLNIQFGTAWPNPLVVTSSSRAPSC
jgi:hypothetical protein